MRRLMRRLMRGIMWKIHLRAAFLNFDIAGICRTLFANPSTLPTDFFFICVTPFTFLFGRFFTGLSLGGVHTKKQQHLIVIPRRMTPPIDENVIIPAVVFEGFEFGPVSVRFGPVSVWFRSDSIRFRSGSVQFWSDFGLVSVRFRSDSIRFRSGSVQFWSGFGLVSVQFWSGFGPISVRFGPVIQLPNQTNGSCLKLTVLG